MNPMPTEIIDAVELARRWNVPVSWIRSKVQASRTPKAEMIPHIQFGKYVRSECGSPALETWLARQRQGRPNNLSRLSILSAASAGTQL